MTQLKYEKILQNVDGIFAIYHLESLESVSRSFRIFTIYWTSSNILRLKGFRSSFGNVPNLNIPSFGREKYDMRLSKWPCSSRKLLATNEMQNNRFVLEKISTHIFFVLLIITIWLSKTKKGLVDFRYTYHDTLIPDCKTISTNWH